MDRFSISQLQQFSGIKAHTIRIWEQRYNALSPSRSLGNTRFYDNHQLRRLLNIVSLMDSDYKLAELCSMSDEKLHSILSEQLKQKVSDQNQNEYYITQLIASGIAFDESQFNKILSIYIQEQGLLKAYVNVVYPMIKRIGLMWASNNIPPAQEHFISNLIRQKFSAITDRLPESKKKENWMLFLPENEFHEIGLLFANYLIKEYSGKVIYLGSNAPLETLINAEKNISVQNLLFFLVHHDYPVETQKYIEEVSELFFEKQIYLSGDERLIKQLTMPSNIKWLKEIEDLEKILKRQK